VITFRKTTWNEIKEGDRVLIAMEGLGIVEVAITSTEIIKRKVDGAVFVVANFSDTDGHHFEDDFDPDAAAYVESRL
jgi:hypothetical protein